MGEQTPDTTATAECYSEDYLKCLINPLRPGLQQVDIFTDRCIPLTEGDSCLTVKLPPEAPVPEKGEVHVEAANFSFLNRDGRLSVKADDESPSCTVTISGLSSRLTLLSGDLLCTLSVRDHELAPYCSEDDSDDDDGEDEEAKEELELARLRGLSSGEEEEEEGEEVTSDHAYSRVEESR